MILFCGRIEPGSGCGAVFTGQSLLANPALTAATSARLSFFVRPLIVGTAIGGSLAAESLPVRFALLDAVIATDGVELATATGAGWAASVVRGPCGGIASPVGDCRASFVAAQANAAISGRRRIMGEEDLYENVRLI